MKLFLRKRISKEIKGFIYSYFWLERLLIFVFKLENTPTHPSELGSSAFAFLTVTTIGFLFSDNLKTCPFGFLQVSLFEDFVSGFSIINLLLPFLLIEFISVLEIVISAILYRILNQWQSLIKALTVHKAYQSLAQNGSLKN